MSHKSTPSTISTIGIDIGKNSFHLVGLDQRGAIVLQQKVSRAQLERRLANIPRCLIGMEACGHAINTDEVFGTHSPIFRIAMKLKNIALSRCR